MTPPPAPPRVPAPDAAFVAVRLGPDVAGTSAARPECRDLSDPAGRRPVGLWYLAVTVQVARLAWQGTVAPNP